MWVVGRIEDNSKQVNLSYNPATGVNYPFSDSSRRPFPQLGAMRLRIMEGRSIYHALETAFTKRFSQGWHVSAPTHCPRCGTTVLPCR